MARVCMIGFCDYPADARIRREAEALVRRGDEVDMICPRSDALGQTRAIKGVRLYPVSRFRRIGGARPIHYIRQYVSFFFGAALRVSRLHLRRRYDVVHVHTMPDALVFSAIVPKLLGAKVILDVHDLMPELYQSKFELPASHWLVRLLVALERLSVRFADVAIAVHRPHLDALVRHGNSPERFEILLNVPDPELFQPLDRIEAPERFTLMYHGMVGTRNGLDIAVRAAAIAREQVPELQLRIVGDGDDFPRVRQLVNELEVQDVVILDQGKRPIEQVLELLLEADVGVVPIIDDPFTQYMLPVKLLEYVAVGLPTIASRTSTIQAYFDEDMVALVTPGDPEVLASKIVELRRNPAQRKALSDAANRFNERHSWAREQEKYYRLVDVLVGLPAAHAQGLTHGKMEVGAT